jgi:hypothetical protein
MEKSSMKVNNDGSVDLYFGPKAPRFESNGFQRRQSSGAGHAVLRAQDAFWDRHVNVCSEGRIRKSIEMIPSSEPVPVETW